MKNHNIIQKEAPGKQTQPTFGLDPMVVLSLIRKNWYFFILALVVAIFGARFYISHTLPQFMVSTTILINETGERQAINNDQLLQGLGLPGGMRNLENQIKILTSREVTERALEELDFDIEVYKRTIRNKLPLYPNAPIEITSDNEIPLPRDTEFAFTYLGNNQFILESKSDYFPFYKQASFGEYIEIAKGNFRIISIDNEWFTRNPGEKLYFVVHSWPTLVNNFNSRINVQLESRGGSLLRISMVGTNRAKDVTFLNKLTKVFQSISLDRKNIEAERRIQFIDDQLVGITDSLSITENKLQQFRSSNRVMDVSAQGQAIITQRTLLENEKAKLNLEANYYDYLAEYLANDEAGEAILVPITMGINDPGLTRLVSELGELQAQLSNQGAGEMNPLQNRLEQRVRNAKEALLETLNGLRRANSLARHENQEQMDEINRQAATLPVTERQLLGIERQFRLNNEIYTFLLETRAEQQMQKASNMADSEVIDPANVQFSFMVSPNPVMVNFIAIFLGFGIPFLIIFLNFIFDKRIKLEDIKRITDIPVVGYIPRSSEKTNTVVLEYPNSSVAEAYRLLRSKMQFFTKDARSPVILVTSPMPEDGKTYTAINLASVYSLLGKKTILVGFDLRKPKIFEDFDLENAKGVSTWLIGQHKIEDIIQNTSFQNLSVISAGPVPPNPSELTALERTEELIKILKEKYEIIIIDSSPIGFISDTFHLASKADATILVVRSRKTLKDMLEVTLREMNIQGTKDVSLVINDTQSENKQYVYGDKFGYTNDMKRPKKQKSKLSKKQKTSRQTELAS